MALPDFGDTYNAGRCFRGFTSSFLNTASYDGYAVGMEGLWRSYRSTNPLHVPTIAFSPCSVSTHTSHVTRM